MTILEAIKHISSGSLTDAQINASLEFAGVIGSNEWNPEDVKLKCKVYGLALQHMAGGDGLITEISESGGMTYKFSDKAIQAKYYNIALQSGCSSLINQFKPAQPQIRYIGNY